MELGIVLPWVATYTLLTAVVLNKLEPAFVYSICSAWAYVDTEGFRRESVSQS